MIPNPVVKRLPKYLAYVQDLVEEGVQWASSHDIAEALGLTSSTVRQDLSHVELTGISKKGYETSVLERELSKALGADQSHTVVIVGAGNLGCALAERGSLTERGFKICGLFDNNPELKGQQVGRLKIASMKTMERVIRKQEVEIGIIAVPAPAAQPVADQLIEAGIRAILNLAYAHILAPPEVAVVDARIVESLQELAYAVTIAKRNEETPADTPTD